MYRLSLLLIVFYILQADFLYAQYASGADTEGTDAIHADSSAIIGWASKISVIPGYINIAEKEKGKVTLSDSGPALGKSDNLTISLGDSGVAVVGFDIPIVNNSGHDFAVFENSFDGNFLELAKVEVSSDSLRWVEFPSESLTNTQIQVETFGELNPENIYNLAGKYKALYGTPFNLDDISDSSGIDLQAVRYIRIRDVVGSVNELYASRDSQGNIINDPWPTPFETSGFDLDAVAVLGSGTGLISPEIIETRIWPNPASDIVYIEAPGIKVSTIDFIDYSGRVFRKNIVRTKINEVDISELKPGIYYIRFNNHKAGDLRLIKK